MEVRRTAPVKLVVPDEYHDDLHETAEQFLYCANEASDYCWDNTDYEDCITSNVTARDALYDRLRAETELTTSSRKPSGVPSTPSIVALTAGRKANGRTSQISPPGVWSTTSAVPHFIGIKSHSRR